MTDSQNTDYNERVKSQIEQYVDEAIHDLPPIFHVWSNDFVLPGFKDVFGVETINDFYKSAVETASQGLSQPARILSIGCGDGSVEIDLAKSLLESNFRDFRLEAVDISPVLIDRFQDAVREAGLQDFVFPAVSDLNRQSTSDVFDVIIANHSLHHMVDLEKVFDFVRDSLADEGIFATCDMIGRNGHMRWPETKAVIQSVWPLLSERQRFHHQLLRLDAERFEDHDCSGEGFEGIRAQDILYLILNRFVPSKFFAYGGFIDIFVDRGYGHGFDAEDERDRNLIVSLAKINDMMLDAGMIKPTIMIAQFTKSGLPQRHYRSRDAISSLRHPFETPAWVDPVN